MHEAPCFFMVFLLDLPDHRHSIGHLDVIRLDVHIIASAEGGFGFAARICHKHPVHDVVCIGLRFAKTGS